MYYFSEINIRGNHAGTKARNDVEKILKQYGALPINSRPFVLRSDRKDANIYSNVKTRFDLARYFFDAWRVRHQFVVIQYPMLAFDFEQEYFREIAKRNKLVFLIHDIHSLRMPDEDKLKREISLLNMGYAVIVHNHFMESKLKELGLTVPRVFSLELFDYLFKEAAGVPMNKEKETVCFAGNLAKSVFLSDFIKKNPGVQINLYGSGMEDALSGCENVRYCGNFSPDEIPGKLEAKYGLVWDGDSVSDCTGALGEYTRINNPHKLSLYLAAGLPVIVWNKAAVSEYVKAHQVGITVDCIDNLWEALAGVSDQEYLNMLDSVKKVQSEITVGNQLRSVLKQIESLEDE